MTQIVLNVENASIAASLKKVLSAMEGVSISETKKMSSYEISKRQAKEGKVHTYSSVDELFNKVCK